MSAPTPAAVRAAMKYIGNPLTPEEREAYHADPRGAIGVMRDHIRAVAADLRARADDGDNDAGHVGPSELREIADKLEGKA